MSSRERQIAQAAVVGRKPHPASGKTLLDHPIGPEGGNPQSLFAIQAKPCNAGESENLAYLGRGQMRLGGPARGGPVWFAQQRFSGLLRRQGRPGDHCQHRVVDLRQIEADR